MSVAPIPVFRIYLLRHARAAWALPGQSDFDRPLDDLGFADAEILADTAADRGYSPGLVLCSTALRCRQTADAFRRALREDLEIRHVDALYAGAVNVYRDLIAAQADRASLMVVGHNPVIEETLQECLGNEAAACAIPAGYPPGALAVVDFDVPPTGGPLPIGRLADWLDPGVHLA